MIHFLLSHPKARSLFTVRPQQTDVLLFELLMLQRIIVFIKSKKTASTKQFYKALINNTLSKGNLYNG